MSHRLGFDDGASSSNRGGDRAGNGTKHRLKRTRALHHHAKRGDSQGLKIRTMIGHRRGRRPSSELMILFWNSRQGNGLTLGIPPRFQSYDGTPCGGGGFNGVENLFKDRHKRTMRGDCPRDGGFLTTDGTIPRPALKLIMFLGCGGDRHRLAARDGLRGRDFPTHTRGCSDSIH